MATYSVYDNILIKLENVFLRVEMEVDKEITSLLAERKHLTLQLSDLKGKLEVLGSLKRSFDLYEGQESELQNLNRTLFKVLCDKQIQLRFLQEKELVLNGALIASKEGSLPSLQLVNQEYKLRKKLQEIELLVGFLSDDERFAPFLPELDQANEIFDLAIESGDMEKLASVVALFESYFEKIMNIYDLSEEFKVDFKEFKTRILLQANNTMLISAEQIETLKNLQKTCQDSYNIKAKLELEVDKLLFQFAMFKNGKKVVLLEIKNASGELESVLFKEYAIKQKIQELKQYKVELNNQKDSFMKDPTVDGYTEAVQQLETVENRFRRLMMHKNFEKQNLTSRFFVASKEKMMRQFKQEENGYHKLLFQVLHNNHIASQDKMIILRLSKPSKVINSQSGKLFFQRTGKTRSLQNLEKSFKKIQINEIH